MGISKRRKRIQDRLYQFQEKCKEGENSGKGGGVKSVTCVYRGSGWDNGEGRENDANEAGREREVLRGKEVVV